MNDKNNEENITLSDVIRGMQYCVNTSAEIAEQHYVNSFKKFYDDNGKLITQKIKINEHAQIELPLICLCNHGSLNLDEMTVKMHINIKDVKVGITETPFDYHNKKYKFTRGKLSIGLGNTYDDNSESSLAEIEMKYKRTEPPEAVSRLIDKINNTINISEFLNESEVKL